MICNKVSNQALSTLGLTCEKCFIEFYQYPTFKDEWNERAHKNELESARILISNFSAVDPPCSNFITAKFNITTKLTM